MGHPALRGAGFSLNRQGFRGSKKDPARHRTPLQGVVGEVFGADPMVRALQRQRQQAAFGRGELFGVGLGASVEKLFYLPEAHTDFLLAVIAEELGFVGVTVVVCLFAVLVQRCFAIGRQALLLDRVYPALVAQGIGIWLGVQSFINMGVNMGLLPTKGLTLPLMSFGGSGILANCLALGIVLRIDWENRQLMRGQQV